MKIPRDLSGSELIKLLRSYGYEPTRQSGSHIRLTTQHLGEHHITIPNHSPLKVGTLSAIIADIAAHINKSKDELMQELFS
ncbi:MAG: type toxin-antitoxin system HicA family toxin [Bacteroidetes bacterium]|nr:type toxin-antitoxin system HicA family toxin [Bacteroidota bacterium]